MPRQFNVLVSKRIRQRSGYRDRDKWPARLYLICGCDNHSRAYFGVLAVRVTYHRPNNTTLLELHHLCYSLSRLE